MRWLLLILLLLALGLQYRLWLGESSVPELRALQSRIDSQRAENERLRARNEALRAEVRDLRSGLSAMEERARNDLGMIRRGETFFLIPGKSSDE